MNRDIKYQRLWTGKVEYYALYRILSTQSTQTASFA